MGSLQDGVIVFALIAGTTIAVIVSVITVHIAGIGCSIIIERIKNRDKSLDKE